VAGGVDQVEDVACPSFASYSSRTECCLIVIPRSRSRSIEVEELLGHLPPAERPVRSIRRSDKVVLPWSMWAMIEKLRILSCCMWPFEQNILAASVVGVRNEGHSGQPHGTGATARRGGRGRRSERSAHPAQLVGPSGADTAGRLRMTGQGRASLRGRPITTVSRRGCRGRDRGPSHRGARRVEAEQAVASTFRSLPEASSRAFASGRPRGRRPDRSERQEELRGARSPRRRRSSPRPPAGRPGDGRAPRRCAWTSRRRTHSPRSCRPGSPGGFPRSKRTA